MNLEFLKPGQFEAAFNDPDSVMRQQQIQKDNPNQLDTLNLRPRDEEKQRADSIRSNKNNGN